MFFYCMSLFGCVRRFVVRVMALVCLVTVSLPALSEEMLEKVLKLTRSSHEVASASQTRIDQLSEKTRQTVDEVLAAERQLNLVKAYNIQMRRLIQAQEKEKVELQQQIDSISETEQAMLPLLVVMVDRLKELVQEDLPFKLAQRKAELDSLFALVDRADISIAEKYRQILEAYENEVAYGRTIETYTADLIGSEEQVQVSYLRIGRTALYYQTRDGSEGALWLRAEQRWAQLDRGENLNLSKAMQIALQQRVPELLALPLVTAAK
ncbi:MAG: DUF3450 domain-containing protein [Oleiphilaceae bacterium]|nr:DUF3450 domain-containing protein [Oleiphilaceae bacterium]